MWFLPGHLTLTWLQLSFHPILDKVLILRCMISICSMPHPREPSHLVFWDSSAHTATSTYSPCKHFCHFNISKNQWHCEHICSRMVRSTSWVCLLEHSAAQAKPGILSSSSFIRPSDMRECWLLRWWGSKQNQSMIVTSRGDGNWTHDFRGSSS